MCLSLQGRRVSQASGKQSNLPAVLFLQATWLAYSSTLKMEPACFNETSTTRLHSPEDSILRCGTSYRSTFIAGILYTEAHSNVQK
jgi:hypothetical protein